MAMTITHPCTTWAEHHWAESTDKQIEKVHGKWHGGKGQRSHYADNWENITANIHVVGVELSE